jgi:hypothetical protein
MVAGMIAPKRANIGASLCSVIFQYPKSGLGAVQRPVAFPLTDMIAAAADYIPRGRRGVIGLYLSAIVILLVFVVLLFSGGEVTRY